MIEQLDQQGRLVLHEAERVAHRLAHHYIGTEHLLVGLALMEAIGAPGPGEGDGALAGCGLSAAALEQEVVELLGRGRAPLTVRPPLTSTATLVVDRARWHARQGGRSGAAAEDLLLAVMQLADSTAATVLRRLGVEPAAIEDRLQRRKRPEDPEDPDPGDVSSLPRPLVSAAEGVRGAAYGPVPAPPSLESMARELTALRHEVVRLRAEVARLSLLVNGT